MKRIIVAAFVFALLFSIEVLAKPVLLRYQYYAGDVYIYSMEAHGSGKLVTTIKYNKDQNGRKPVVNELPINMDMKMSIDTEVESVEKDGTSKQLTRINEYKLVTDGKVIIDFNKDTNVNETGDDIIKSFKNLIKNPIRTDVDTRGVIKKMAGIEQLTNVESSMDLTGLLEQLQVPLPEKPVEVGDEWTQKIDMNFAKIAGKDNVFDFSFKLAGYEDVKELRCAKIHLVGKGDLKSVLKKMMPDIQNTNITFNKTDFIIEGDMYFATAEGLLVAFDFSMTQKMDGDIEIKGENDDTQIINLLLDMKMDGFTELE